MKYFEIIKENVKIDNVNGIGSVPYNQNVDYFGLNVFVTPMKFLDLTPCLDDNNNKRLNYVKNHLEDNGAIGAPFLIIKIPSEWFDNDFSEPAKIASHEGRHRMKAIYDLYGNKPIETHLFFRDDIKRRHISSEMIVELNKRIVCEWSSWVMTGPWFEI